MIVLQDVQVGGEGNVAATKFSRSNGRYKPDPPSSESLLIQCAPKLSGEADERSHSRQHNVTPMTGRVTLLSTELHGLRGCSSRLQGPVQGTAAAGTESTSPAIAAFCAHGELRAAAAAAEEGTARQIPQLDCKQAV